VRKKNRQIQLEKGKKVQGGSHQFQERGVRRGECIAKTTSGGGPENAPRIVNIRTCPGGGSEKQVDVNEGKSVTESTRKKQGREPQTQLVEAERRRTLLGGYTGAAIQGVTAPKANREKKKNSGG